MPGQHRVIRLGPGIVRDGNALVAEVRIGSSRGGTQTRKRERFALGTDLATIRAWQHGARYDLATAAPSAPGRGTLAADLNAFVDALPAGRYRIDTEDLLTHWATSPIGDRDRRTLTRLDLIAVISAWTSAGVAESTCNQRLSRLRKVFQALDGLDGNNPTDGIARLRAPKAEPRDIPARIVQLILDALPDRGRAARGDKRPKISQSKIRLRVMAWTGIPPATLQRVRPRDLDLPRARIYLRPRRKGKGTHGAWVTLLPIAVDAFRDFAAADLFGRTWSAASLGKTWRVGIARATKAAARVAAETGDQTWTAELDALPPRCHPYDLRHAFASAVYRETGDIGAVSELLQHSSLETTKRYTQGAVSARVAAAIAKAGAAYATIPTIPAPVAQAGPRLRLVRTGGS
jgi:integrase